MNTYSPMYFPKNKKSKQQAASDGQRTAKSKTEVNLPLSEAKAKKSVVETEAAGI